MAEGGLDPALVERAKACDEEASRCLVQELYPLVLKIVRAHRPRRVDEDEMTQIVFVKMFQKLEQYSGEAPFPHWVSRVAVNTCLNELRSEKARPELRWADLPEEQADALDGLLQGNSAAPNDDAFAARELVNLLLQTLPPLDRSILTMLDLEGRTAKEAAALLQSNATVVKVRAFRARAKLRKQLEQLERGQEMAGRNGFTRTERSEAKPQRKRP